MTPEEKEQEIERRLERESFEDMVYIDEEKLLGEPLATLDESVDSIVFVDGLPVTVAAKAEVLTKKVMVRIGMYVNEDKSPYAPIAVDMPLTEAGKTQGFLAIECSTADAAKQLIEKVDGRNFLKDKCKMTVIPYADVIKHVNVPDEFDEEAARADYPDYAPPMVLDDWLKDERCRAHAVTLEGFQLGITSVDPVKAPETEIVSENHDHTESSVSWTRQGSFLYNRQGDTITQLVGNAPGETVLTHPGLQGMQPSPQERHVITMSSGEMDAKTKVQQNPHYGVWSVHGSRTTPLRRLPHRQKQPEVDTTRPSKMGEPPAYIPELCSTSIAISPTDKYVLYAFGTKVLIYETARMDRKKEPLRTLQLPGLVAVEWSPVDDYLSIVQAAHGNSPAKISIVNVPKLCKQMGVRNLHNVESTRLTWHPQGTFLAATSVRTLKGRASTTSIDIFRVRQTRAGGVATEFVEYKPEGVGSVAFEPHGVRMAVTVGSVTQPATENDRPRFVAKTVDLYTLTGVTEGALVRTGSLDIEGHGLRWSPAGRILAAFPYEGPNEVNKGDIKFIDTNNNEIAASRNHPAFTDVEWDPTGRFMVVATRYSVCPNCDYYIYSHRGQMLHKVSGHQFHRFLWRPMPVAAITDADRKTIDYKADARAFERTDAELRNAMDESEAAGRRAERRVWLSWVSDSRAALEAREESWRKHAPAAAARVFNDEKDEMVEITLPRLLHRSEQEKE